MGDFGKTLIGLGVLLVVVGVAVSIGGKLGFGRLPGDIAFRRGNTSFYFPIVSSIVASIILTILENIFLKRR